MKSKSILPLLLLVTNTMMAGAQALPSQEVPASSWAYNAVTKLEKLTGLKVVHACFSPKGHLMLRGEFAVCAGRYDHYIATGKLSGGNLKTARGLVLKLKKEFSAEIKVIYGARDQG